MWASPASSCALLERPLQTNRPLPPQRESRRRSRASPVSALPPFLLPMSPAHSPVALRLAVGAVTVGLGTAAWYLLTRKRKMPRAVEGGAVQFLEREILEYAVQNGKPGDPVSVYDSIDRYCYNFGWAMNTGDKKGEQVDKILEERRPGLILELGGYVGYSAIRFGNKQRSILGPSANPLFVSVEIDPLMAAISSKLVEHAGLESTVKVVIGTLSTAADKVKALVGQHRNSDPLATVPFDLIYIDHWKEQYVPDFLRLEELGFIGKGTTVVADNIINPGAPEYLQFMTESRREQYNSELVESTLEYTNIRDAMLVSVKK